MEPHELAELELHMPILSTMIHWHKFSEVEPPVGQICLVCAGLNGKPRIQYIALRWNGESFSWMDDEEESAFDDFPTKEARLWAKFPDDPISA